MKRSTVRSATMAQTRCLILILIYSSTCNGYAWPSELMRRVDTMFNSTGWHELGCYNDSGADRTLSQIGYVLGGPDNMTAENCQEGCRSAGYDLAGVEYSYQCFCDNKIRNYGASASDGYAQCTMTCNGNASESCGGPNRLNLYTYINIPATEAPSSSQVSSLVSSPLITPPPSTVGSTATAVASTTASVTVINSWAYLGCYNDSLSGRTLSYTGYVLGGPGNMTVENCEAACYSEGYILAGVEYSGQCFCDNEFRNYGGPASDGNAQCTMTCNGDPEETCGGPNRLNMYSFTGATATSVIPSVTGGASATASTTGSGIPAPTSIPTGWSYMGCYKDNVHARRVMGNQQDDNSNLTVESCIDVCAGMNYTVAGMEYSSQCFCDDFLRDNTTLAASNSDCAMTCSGDSSEICGGPNLLSVYSTGNLTILPVPAAQTTDLPGMWKYQGCLQDNVNGERTFPYEIIYADNNTVQTCLSRCAAYGFGAAGLEYGSQCFCGDVGDIGPDVLIVPDSQCQQECSGNATQICGDGNLMSYYSWAGPALQSWSYPTGNDAGRYEFLIGGVVVPLMTTVNINGKITFVEKWGTGPPNSTGAYEFDPAFENDFSKAWRTMHVKTDVFCGVGLVLPDRVGRQVVLGGWSGESTEAIRLYWPDGSPGHESVNDFQENVNELYLQDGRWYPSAMIMANGSILVVGGEEGSNAPPVPTIEILPKVGPTVYMEWLERTDPNNLYPFLTVLPSGGIFVVYYNEARILDENTFETIKTFPKLPGSVDNDAGGRTYPLEGTMVTLPQHAPYGEPITALVCGGSANFVGPVIDNCVSIQPEVENATWTLERMPSKRVMSCMAPLPDGTILILNGAHVGVAGFGLASSPNFNAVLYDPSKPVNSRMSVMANTTIARMYHSEAILMQDGRVLVSGSDPQTPGFPEEYRVEVFIPPYLLSGAPRPTFTIQDTDWAHGGTYQIQVTSGNLANIKISLIGLVSTTHGNSYGARTFFPQFSCSGSTCSITAPPNAHVCPPGWFHLFVLDGPTPSVSAFVRIGGDPAELGNWPDLSDFTIPGV